MSWKNNVPVDWSSYFRVCGLCGARLHESEGVCNCSCYFEELSPCGCGAGEWVVDSDGGVYCVLCGGQPKEGVLSV